MPDCGFSPKSGILFCLLQHLQLILLLLVIVASKYLFSLCLAKTSVKWRTKLVLHLAVTLLFPSRSNWQECSGKSAVSSSIEQHLSLLHEFIAQWKLRGLWNRSPRNGHDITFTLMLFHASCFITPSPNWNMWYILRSLTWASSVYVIHWFFCHSWEVFADILFIGEGTPCVGKFV